MSIFKVVCLSEQLKQVRARGHIQHWQMADHPKLCFHVTHLPSNCWPECLRKLLSVCCKDHESMSLTSSVLLPPAILYIKCPSYLTPVTYSTKLCNRKKVKPYKFPLICNTHVLKSDRCGNVDSYM